jgi:hypothetical protein
MCTRIPLGAHGEEFLMKSLNKLKAFSSFGDLVLFGVGVRHFLRDIVQTTEAASLVALCAALSETYPTNVAALILYEMAKELKASSELSPSLAQWGALVTTSSCAFKETTFSLRIEKLIKLAGFSSSLLSGDLSDSRASPGHPQDIAGSIIALGEIMRGAVETVTIHGGRASCWLATYASLVLGLRVHLSANGKPLFQNYDERKVDAQLYIDAAPDVELEQSLQQVRTTFTVRSGRDFVQQVFGWSDDGNITQEPGVYQYFLAGSTPWDTIIVDTFGENGQRLLDQLAPNESTADGYYYDILKRAPFRMFFEASVLSFIYNLGDADDYRSVSDYMTTVVDRVPELGVFKPGSLPGDLTDFSLRDNAFRDSSDALRAMCGCSRCTMPSGSDERGMCLVLIADTIVFLAYLMERCHLHSNLRPRRFGVHALYIDMQRRRWKIIHERSQPSSRPHLETLFGVDTDELFGSYAVLFTGTRSRQSAGSTSAPRQFATASAYAAGGVYCFMDSLLGLSMNHARASRVHVGSGVIECRSRLHRWVFNLNDRIVSPTTSDYPAEEITFSDDLSALGTDFPYPSLTLEAVVEDTFHLVLYYRIKSSAGRRLISPATFVIYTLAPISQNALWARLLGVSKANPNYKAICSTYDVARGEGEVTGTKRPVLLRPHKGNPLAQYVAASWCPLETGYVISNEEAERILHWLARKPLVINKETPFSIISG